MGFSFLDILFPKFCAGCGRQGLYLCPKCKFSQKIHGFICSVCEKPSIGGMTHQKCRSQESFDGAIFLFSYSPPVSNLIKKLKYQRGLDLLNVLVEWSASQIAKQQLPHKRFVLIPIPLHPLRENWRGFNHVALLGERITNKMGWDYDPNILERVKIRRTQAKLKGEERKENIKDVFKVSSNRPFVYSSILLFDDVWTTGSTMKEAAKALKQAGAKFIWGLTIAR